MRWLVLGLGVASCGSSKPAPKVEPAATPADAAAKPPPSKWTLPAGWRGEVIPFPLDFAPSIKHAGTEELRFPKGFFDPASPEYWSYAFVWRTTDAAVLDAKALAGELTQYFRGLINAVDEKQEIKARDTIVATADADGARFKLSAHVFDAFKTKLPLDLSGWAERRACGTGALWIFVLAPEKTTIRSQLDELARVATCD